MTMTFKAAVLNTTIVARTANGMKAIASTLDRVTDLFYAIGASRGKDVTKLFELAYQDDKELALRVAQWARDVRGGAGERELFRQILKYMEKFHKKDLLETRILRNVSEIGRWDDLLVFEDTEVKDVAYGLIAEALVARNGLVAKWLPRRGNHANDLRNYLKLTPKQYRKLVVALTNVVETKMCAKDWSSINFSHVPSLAMSRYTKAFAKQAPAEFTIYKEALASGDPSVKVNVSAVYPYDVIKIVNKGDATIADAMWNALPDYVGDANVLPLVDVSGSMASCKAGGYNSKSYVTCLDVAVSLGLYTSSKNSGVFKDLFLTFSAEPEFVHLKGSLSEKMRQMNTSDWEMNTNLHVAFEEILKVAVKNNVAQEDMPQVLLVMSDMQFDECTEFDDSANEMITRNYMEAGYDIPKIVFWNLNASDNVPVKFDTNGVALVSGFSPAILKAVLASDLEDFTPKSIMLKTIMNDRYAI
jgi:hypothetical protein